jgi:flagella synthesis protein FlgN
MTDLILSNLQEESSLLGAFDAVLAEERHALTRGNILDTLPAVTSRKAAIGERLADLERSRNTQLQSLGYPQGHAGMEQAAMSDPRVADAWQTLLGAVRRVHDANGINGRLVRVRLDYNQRALGALRNAAGMTTVYGPDGRFAVRGR